MQTHYRGPPAHPPELSSDRLAMTFDLQPTLTGTAIVLRPLTAEDFEALYAVGSDPAVWAQHPTPDRWQPEPFRRFFDGALASGGALVAVDRRDGRVLGTSRYYDWEPATASITIGYTFLGRDSWGGRINREMKHLMLGHAFTQAKQVWFHIGRDNGRSRAAIERLGARLSHSGVVDMDGKAVDYVYYVMDRPRIVTVPPFRVIGLSATMCHARDTAGDLWRQFRPLCQAINHRPDTDFVSLTEWGAQGPLPFDPERTFTRWAAVQVTGHDVPPAGLDAMTVPGGTYAALDVMGPASEGARIYRYLLDTWLPATGRQLDSRPFFEVLPADYRPDDPAARETIYVPIVDSDP